VFERIGQLWLERRHPPRADAIRGRLLCVHGMWGGSWYWTSWLRRFAEAGWDAWAVNLRGHHGSHPGLAVDGLGLRDYVADVVRCMEGIGEVALVGHGMGGLLVQAAAAETAPPAAVVLASAPPRGVLAVRGAVLRRLPRYLGTLASGRGFRPTPADAEALLFNNCPPDLRRDACARLVPESGRAVREIALGRLAVDSRRLRGPLLVVGAALDAVAPAAVQRRIAARYRAEYRELAGRAHMPMLEPGWEAAADELLGWLGRARA
jgi:pimeloyl-ACP methyl ester carboxylesterase